MHNHHRDHREKRTPRAEIAVNAGERIENTNS